MDKTTRSFGHIYLAILIAYYYFSIFMLGQYLLTTIGPEIVLVLIAFSLIFPILLLIITSKMEVLRNTINSLKSHPLIIKLILSFYLLITTSLLLVYNASFITTYYYEDWNLLIIIGLLIIPSLAFSKYSIKSFFRMAIVFFAFIIITNFLYFFKTEYVYFFNFSIGFPSDTTKIMLLIIGGIFAIFEPLMIVFFIDYSSTPIKKKKIIGLASFFIIVGIATNLRLIGEFGIVLLDMSYPYFISWRNIFFNEYTQNLDHLTIIYWLSGTIMRLLFAQALFIKVWKINKQEVSGIITILSGFIAYLLLVNINLYNQLYQTLLSICAVILVMIAAYLLTKLFKIRGKIDG